MVWCGRQQIGLPALPFAASKYLFLRATIEYIIPKYGKM